MIVIPTKHFKERMVERFGHVYHGEIITKICEAISEHMEERPTLEPIVEYDLKVINPPNIVNITVRFNTVNNCLITVISHNKRKGCRKFRAAIKKQKIKNSKG